MISLNNISLRFGGFTLLNDISFLITPKDRVGLVGKNGAGKSTILKLILGMQKPDEGSISMPNEMNFGYLPQHMKFNDRNTVWDETNLAYENINEIEQKINQLATTIAEREDYNSADYQGLLDKLAFYNERLEILGGRNIEAEIEQTLLGLGFEKKDFDRPTTELSGGWRMRIELAKILLKKPDILLLDEPTNHLDIESIQWLEDYLQNFPGAVLLISHDRAFLDNITKRTIEISLSNIYDYKVPYSKFVQLRKERREQQEAAYNNQQKMIKDTERFIERFRYKNTKAVQVQSRVKKLEKLERIEIDDEDKAAMHFNFPPAPHSGTIVVETKQLTKKYDDHIVFKDIDLIIEKGEKVAFVGRNGEGKTTLSRIIVNDLDYTGTLKPGHNVKIGYYAQNQDELLDENKTVFQTIDDIAVGDIRTKVRDILGAFLFSGEDVDKKVKVLSGGERSRLALARLLLEPVNLLVLDEPTNHLDMLSKDILKNALLKYNGTLILVSHDRYFLDGLTDKIYEFKDQKIKQTIGGIYDFLRKKKISNFKELEAKKQVKTTKNKDITEQKLSYEAKKELEKEIRKLSNQVQKSEKSIESIETRIAEIDQLLSNPNPENDQLNNPKVYDEYEQLKVQLENEMEKWESLTEELEVEKSKRTS